MIKRPLNQRFAGPVLEGRKTTTIRAKPWPVGVPIMLYHWSGAAYRSKHVDVAEIVVYETSKIVITRTLEDRMYLDCMAAVEEMELGKCIPLWKAEGFDSRDELHAWFRPLVKPGQTVTKHLMRFRLAVKRLCSE